MAETPQNGQQRSRFTPTQCRILRVLADGLPHKSRELKLCLLDGEQASLAAVRQHIHQMRKVLRTFGEDVVCVFSERSFQYQHIRIVRRAPTAASQPPVPAASVATP